MNFPKLFLKKNEERRILAGHLWIFSNEVDTKRSPLRAFSSGELVEVVTSKDRSLGIAYINPNALICARLLTSDMQKTIDSNFFIEQISNALRLRENYFKKPFYRLVYGESDYLPGLIIDRYAEIFVIQTNTAGMEKLQNFIIEALTKLFNPEAIILKNDSKGRQLEALESYVKVATGNPTQFVQIEENSAKFRIPLLEGQKTGWFYDHRDNRARLKKYVKDKTVLDAFCYLGGWGIQAAQFGARQVTFIDSSAKAIELVKINAMLNGHSDKIISLQDEVFAALKQLVQQKQKFDVIVLDPPALIQKRKDIDQGIIAYLRLNELAMQLLNDKGILVSCSCSLHMSLEMLINIIRRSSVKLQKTAQIMEIGFQSLDHPIHPAIFETAYLKAIFCQINS